MARKQRALASFTSVELVLNSPPRFQPAATAIEFVGRRDKLPAIYSRLYATPVYSLY